MKNNVFVKLLASLFFAVVSGYFIASLLRSLNENSNVQGNVLDYEGTFDFLLNGTTDNQAVVLILSGLIFAFMFSLLNKKAKTYEDASDFGVHGTARMATFDEVIDGEFLSKKNKYKPKNPKKAFEVERGVILGKVPKKNELLILPKETKIDNRNVLVVGSSGSGKGQSYVLPNLLNNTEETMIVTDPKGELYDDTAELKREQGYQVYQIDFTNFEKGGYNPLDYVKDDQDAQKIAKTIAKNSAKDGKEDFFQVEGQRLLTALIIYCKHEYGDEANIPDHVMTMFNHISKDEDFVDNLLEEMDESHPAYRQLQTATVAEGKTRSSILASFTQQTGIFTIDKVANTTRQSTFNFHEFQEHKSILYVKLPMDENPFLALTATFFDQLISVFYEIADQNGSHLKIDSMFMLDEFANIGKIEKYGRVLSTCRGLGIGMSTIVQDFAQIEEQYGKELKRTILSNHDTTIYLRTKDDETAKYFSELSGETTARMETNSTSQQGGILSTKHSSSKSNQEQYVKRELIQKGDLLALPKEKSYIFIAGFHPLATEKAWQSEIYGDLIDDFSKYRNTLFQHKSNSPNVEEQTDHHLIDEDIDKEEKDLPPYDKETGEILEEPQQEQENDSEENQEEESSLSLNDLDELVKNPRYMFYQQEQQNALNAIKQADFEMEHADKITEIFNEETKEYEDDIEEDKESLPM